MTSKTGIIVALDVDDASSCLALVERLDSAYCALKIGSELFTRCGPDIVKACVSKGFRVFLDLKFHDIPNTVMRATLAAADLGVWMLNVHALGGLSMMESARRALGTYGNDRPLLIAVTVLTSHDEASLSDLGIVKNINEQALHLAGLAHRAGLDGVVCSGFEVAAIKQCCGQSFLTVTPGIRLEGERKDDQVRVLTPHEAKRQGSDHLVIGRALRHLDEPGPYLEQLYQELNSD